MTNDDTIESESIKKLHTYIFISAIKDLLDAKRHILLGRKVILDFTGERFLASRQYEDNYNWLMSNSNGNNESISFLDICESLSLNPYLLRKNIFDKIELLKGEPKKIKIQNFIKLAELKVQFI